MFLYIVLFILALILLFPLLVYWLRGPGREAVRVRTIEILWRERGRILAALDSGTLTHFECVQLRDRLFEINAELIALGVPSKVTQ